MRVGMVKNSALGGDESPLMLLLQFNIRYGYHFGDSPGSCKPDGLNAGLRDGLRQVENIFLRFCHDFCLRGQKSRQNLNPYLFRTALRRAAYGATYILPFQGKSPQSLCSLSVELKSLGYPTSPIPHNSEVSSGRPRA